MGVYPKKSCSLNAAAPAPNPDPSRWVSCSVQLFDHAYVHLVKYEDCTNYGGRKILVFKGDWIDGGGEDELDPHFSEQDTRLIARFVPTLIGWGLACQFAENYKESEV